MPPALIAKLVIILIIAGSGVIRWIVVQLQEQAARKKAQEELARREVEGLRTGGVSPESDPREIRARLEAEAAARRQAQIEEFRRRQQERAKQRAAGPAPPPRPVPQPKPVQAPKPAPKRGPKQLLTPTASAIPEPETTHRLVAEARPAAKAAGTPAKTPENWRRAIVMSTILTPPQGLRDEGQQDPWAPVG